MPPDAADGPAGDAEEAPTGAGDRLVIEPPDADEQADGTDIKSIVEAYDARTRRLDTLHTLLNAFLPSYSERESNAGGAVGKLPRGVVKELNLMLEEACRAVGRICRSDPGRPEEQA